MNTELKKLIAKALNKPAEEIEIVQQLGGLTNENYKVIVGADTYAVRFAGKGTEEIIDRLNEKKNSEVTSKLGINPEVIFFDESSGLKIVRYIANAETINPKTGKLEDNLALVAKIFQKLHTSGEQFHERFDVFEKISEYETVLANFNGKVFEDHEQVRKQVFELKDYYLSLNVPIVPCHNDPLAENFIKSGKDKMYLVDWEYSGMNDPMWDIAAYIIEAELSPIEEDVFVQQYFNGNMTEENRKQLLLNKIFVDFLWTLWALIREAVGEDLGDYALTRYNRAKNFLQQYYN